MDSMHLMFAQVDDGRGVPAVTGSHRGYGHAAKGGRR
jgi:hypothetical protein